MSTKTILTKILRDGREATVSVGDSGGRVCLTARIVGAGPLGCHTGPTHEATGGAPAGYRAVGKLALTPNEADTVDAAYRAAVAAQPRDLRGERDTLVNRINAAEGAWADDRAAAWDRFDGGGNPFRGDAANEVRIHEHRDALAAFDAEHPEIVAEVATETRAMVQRAIEN